MLFKTSIVTLVELLKVLLVILNRGVVRRVKQILAYDWVAASVIFQNAWGLLSNITWVDHCSVFYVRLLLLKKTLLQGRSVVLLDHMLLGLFLSWDELCQTSELWLIIVLAIFEAPVWLAGWHFITESSLRLILLSIVRSHLQSCHLRSPVLIIQIAVLLQDLPLVHFSHTLLNLCVLDVKSSMWRLKRVSFEV